MTLRLGIRRKKMFAQLQQIAVYMDEQKKLLFRKGLQHNKRMFSLFCHDRLALLRGLMKTFPNDLP